MVWGWSVRVATRKVRRLSLFTCVLSELVPHAPAAAISRLSATATSRTHTFLSRHITQYRYTGATQRISGPDGSAISFQVRHVAAMEAFRTQPRTRCRRDPTIWRAAPTLALCTASIIDTSTVAHTITPALTNASTYRLGRVRPGTRDHVRRSRG
jgi:hypothetical protein